LTPKAFGVEIEHDSDGATEFWTIHNRCDCHLSWLAISNHCAFSAVAAPVAETQSACPFHSKPAKQKKQSAGVQCCKTLRAVVPTVAKSWTRNDTDFSDVDLYFEELALIAYSHNKPPPLLLDTGRRFSHSRSGRRAACIIEFRGRYGPHYSRELKATRLLWRLPFLAGKAPALQQPN
jgi:hypothetical protein